MKIKSRQSDFTLVFVVCMTFIRIRPVKGLCDPISQRLIDPATNRTFSDGSVCPPGEFCKATDPPTMPLRGACTQKAVKGSPCTSNAGCEPGTEVEGNKFVCSKKPGDPSGTCGCLHDYLSPEEKVQLLQQTGFSWEPSPDGKGCIKYVLSKRPCNPRTDVCSDSNLECRPQDGKDGPRFCLYPFGNQDDGDDCYDNSDCRKPFTCEVADDGHQCGCGPGLKPDPASSDTCIAAYVGYLIQCTTHHDCIPEWNIRCHPRRKLCECTERRGRGVFEYFQQINKQDRCYLTHDIGVACDVAGVLTATGPAHNCRRKNPQGIETNLQCVSGKCACEQDHFEYQRTTTVCVQLHAWFGEPCFSDSVNASTTDEKIYQCDSKLHLTCGIDFKCQCVHNAKLLPNKMKACKLQTTLRKMGESCDNISFLCDADLHLSCNNSICSCVNDPTIVTEGQNCRFINYRTVAHGPSLVIFRWFTFLFPLSVMNF